MQTEGSTTGIEPYNCAWCPWKSITDLNADFDDPWDYKTTHDGWLRASHDLDQDGHVIHIELGAGKDHSTEDLTE